MVGFTIFLESGHDIVVVQTKANEIISDIEKFKKANGHYPRRLAEATANMTADRVSTRYVPATDEEAFELVVGDYERFGFVMIWSSVDQQWTVDD